MFDGVQIGRVRWQLDENSAGAFDQTLDIVSLMPRRIIHDDRHACFKGRQQVIPDPFDKNLFVDGVVISVGSKELVFC